MTQAREAQIPMVFIAPDENFSAGPMFVARNREAARMLTEHLIALGHRRFAFLGGPEKSADAIERLNGLRDGAGGARAGASRPAHMPVRRDLPAGRRDRRTRSSGWRKPRADRRRPR